MSWLGSVSGPSIACEDASATLQYVPHPADQLLPLCGHRNQNHLRKLARRSKRSLVERLEKGVVNCIGTPDFRFFWGASMESAKLYFRKDRVMIEHPTALSDDAVDFGVDRDCSKMVLWRYSVIGIFTKTPSQ
jgi:hypothetical protein